MPLNETLTPALSLLEEGRGRSLRRISRSLGGDLMRPCRFFSLSHPMGEGWGEGCLCPNLKLCCNLRFSIRL